ncbi:hypothetical protein GF357_03970 [Candidatus Dojkabacteria bacterium]|nr:hypothetical protein [Candidatus Dojkabacteria bacterium]
MKNKKMKKSTKRIVFASLAAVCFLLSGLAFYWVFQSDPFQKKGINPSTPEQVDSISGQVARQKLEKDLEEGKYVDYQKIVEEEAASVNNVQSESDAGSESSTGDSESSSDAEDIEETESKSSQNTADALPPLAGIESEKGNQSQSDSHSTSDDVELGLGNIRIYQIGKRITESDQLDPKSSLEINYDIGTEDTQSEDGFGKSVEVKCQVDDYADGTVDAEYTYYDYVSATGLNGFADYVTLAGKSEFEEIFSHYSEKIVKFVFSIEGSAETKEVEFKNVKNYYSKPGTATLVVTAFSDRSSDYALDRVTISDAEVKIYDSNKNHVKTAFTETAGNLVVRGLEPGQYTVNTEYKGKVDKRTISLAADDFEKYGISAGVPDGNSFSALIPIKPENVDMPKGSISGRAVKDGYFPIQNHKVNLYSYKFGDVKANAKYVTSVATDSDGMFSFNSLEPERYYFFKVADIKGYNLYDAGRAFPIFTKDEDQQMIIYFRN